jgi:hypothetical protein
MADENDVAEFLGLDAAGDVANVFFAVSIIMTPGCCRNEATGWN